MNATQIVDSLLEGLWDNCGADSATIQARNRDSLEWALDRLDKALSGDLHDSIYVGANRDKASVVLNAMRAGADAGTILAKIRASKDAQNFVDDAFIGTPNVSNNVEHPEVMELLAQLGPSAYAVNRAAGHAVALHRPGCAAIAFAQPGFDFSEAEDVFTSLVGYAHSEWFMKRIHKWAMSKKYPIFTAYLL